MVDVISTHNYFNDLPPDEDGTDEFFADMAKTVRDSGNPHLQLWNTEGGIRAGGWHPYWSPDTLPYPRTVPFETARRGAQLAKADILMIANGYSKYFFYISGGPVVTELWGGWTFINSPDLPDLPAFLCDNSVVSLNWRASTFMNPAHAFRTLMRETQNGQVKTLTHTQAETLNDNPLINLYRSKPRR